MWFENSKLKADKKRLINSFPKALKKDVEKVVDILLFDKKISLSDNSIYVILNGEPIQFPYRIYLDEPIIEKENSLTVNQKIILNCIFSRHYNGFIRQRRLELQINKDAYFITPFSIQLLGEYVKEILFILDIQITNNNLPHYQKFIAENKKYWKQTESRMISYWNAYYRYPDCRHINNYIGKKVVTKIKNAL
jgi:hypothetical protein